MQRRFRIGFALGIILVLVGLFLAVKGDSLATNWQPLGEGAWGGTTDPEARRMYQTVGYITLTAGFLVGGATWFQWLPQRPSETTRS